MSGSVSSLVTSYVKYYCSSTATEDMSAAMSLFNFYCSAAEKKVVATAIESIKETYPIGTGGSGGSKTGSKPGSATATPTGGSPGDGSSGGGGGETGSGGISRGAVIAIAVLASVVGIAVIAAIFIIVRRRQRKNAEQLPLEGESQPPTASGPNELPSQTQSPWSELDAKSQSPAQTGPMATDIAANQNHQYGYPPQGQMHEAGSTPMVNQGQGHPQGHPQGTTTQDWYRPQGQAYEMDATYAPAPHAR